MLRFTDQHEWLKIEDGVATIGITHHAQEQLGDLVFVELPDRGATVEKGAGIGVVESVKAASDVYAPVTGEVLEINERVVSEPGLVNSDPMGKGWLFRLRLANASELDGLKDEAAYKAMINK